MSDGFVAFLFLWGIFLLGFVSGCALMTWKPPWHEAIYSCELINDVYRINTSENPSSLTDPQIDCLVQECDRQKKKVYAQLTKDGFKFIDPKSLMGNAKN